MPWDYCSTLRSWTRTAASVYTRAGTDYSHFVSTHTLGWPNHSSVFGWNHPVDLKRESWNGLFTLRSLQSWEYVSPFWPAVGFCVLYLYPLLCNEVWREGYNGITVSVCLSVRVFGFCPDDIFWIAQPRLTKVCMVVNYHESECHAQKPVRYFQGQVHSEGLYDQNMTVSTISSRLLVHFQPDLEW